MLSLQAWQSARSMPCSSAHSRTAELARPPHEALVEAAGVAAVARLVGRGDQVVEAERLGEGGDHVDRRRGGQDQTMAVGSERGQALGGERGHELAERGDGPAAGGLHLFLVPSSGHPGGRPDEAHGEQVLPEAVVDGVQELVAGQGSAGGQDPLRHQGLVEHLARGVAQQGPVEVDEDGALGHGLSLKQLPFAPPARRAVAADGRPGERRAETSRKLGEGIAGGEGDPFSRLTRGRRGGIRFPVV